MAGIPLRKERWALKKIKARCITNLRRGTMCISKGKGREGRSFCSSKL